MVRWSLDLRWQDPCKPWGYHGLIDGMPFRKSDDRDWRPSEEDWVKFLKVPRAKAEAGVGEDQVKVTPNPS